MAPHLLFSRSPNVPLSAVSLSWGKVSKVVTKARVSPCLLLHCNSVRDAMGTAESRRAQDEAFLSSLTTLPESYGEGSATKHCSLRSSMIMSPSWLRRRPPVPLPEDSPTDNQQRHLRHHSLETSQPLDRQQEEATPRTSQSASKLIQGFLERTRTRRKRGTLSGSGSGYADGSAHKRPDLQGSARSSPVSSLSHPLRALRTCNRAPLPQASSVHHLTMIFLAVT